MNTGQSEIIPEMHDILKIAKKQKIGGEDVAVNPHSNPHLLVNIIDTKIWEGICKHHHEKNFKTWPDSSDLVILDIADNLASAASRALRLERGAYRKYGTDDAPFKLWKNEITDVRKGRTKRPLSIKEIIEFVSHSPTADEYLQKYKQYLLERAEDAIIGINITSLFTHSVLTGKFYRILKEYETSVPMEILDDRQKVEEFIKNINWKLTIIKLKLHFHQNPVRIKDLNVFKQLESAIKEINDRFPDNIIFSTSDELLVVSTNQDILKEIEKICEKYGFWLEINRADGKLSALHPEPSKMVGNRSYNKYFETENTKEINPPICEICQMFQATKELFDEESGIKEELCERCYNNRKMGALFPTLSQWERENARVIWIKITLNTKSLVRILRKLYINYLKHFNVSDAEKKAEIRFSVLSEFQEDYQKFLREFTGVIIDKYGEENVQIILRDFLSIKIQNDREIRDILEIYKRCFETFFPKFKEDASPIKLSMICGNAKFPFIWNWKILSDPKNDININVIGKGEMNIRIGQIDELLGIKLPSIKLLIDLSKISIISKKLAWLMLNDRGDKRTYKEFEGLRRAIISSGLDYETILTFAKIMGD